MNEAEYHKPTGPEPLAGYCGGCGDTASKHEGSFCPEHYSTGEEQQLRSAWSATPAVTEKHHPTGSGSSS